MLMCMVIVIVAICLAIWWSLVAYGRWKDDPIAITMATNALPIQNIKFPSITICPQGMLSDFAIFSILVLHNNALRSFGSSLINNFCSRIIKRYHQCCVVQTIFGLFGEWKAKSTRKQRKQAEKTEHKQK